MKKFSFLKRIFLILAFFVFLSPCLFAFDSGFVFNLKANFGGSLTLPSITEQALKDMNPMATAMTGVMSGLLMGAEGELGYVFRSHDFMGLSPKNPFSGAGAFFALGFSQGNASQKITADVSGNQIDMFMIVDYLPVINFDLKGKAYFFDNKLALGLGVGGKMIADMNPKYLVYSTAPDVIKTEIGTIIVTEEMMKKMNALMVSTKFLMEYNIKILDTTEFILGWSMGFNWYRPMYLTMPPSLAKLAKDNNPDFDVSKKQPDYWINTFDLGLSLGLGFKL